jgi:hypothetical protein
MGCAATDPLLAGADGVAFGDKTILYVNSVTAGKLLRLDLGPDRKATRITDLMLPRKLDRPMECAQSEKSGCSWRKIRGRCRS